MSFSHCDNCGEAWETHGTACAGGAIQRPPEASEAHTRWVLLMRHHDKRNDRWSAWEELSAAELQANYGTAPEQWRDTCRRWIEIGGTYEFKIVRRTDTVEWSIHYENTERIRAEIKP